MAARAGLGHQGAGFFLDQTGLRALDKWPWGWLDGGRTRAVSSSTGQTQTQPQTPAPALVLQDRTNVWRARKFLIKRMSGSPKLQSFLMAEGARGAVIAGSSGVESGSPRPAPAVALDLLRRRGPRKARHPFGVTPGGLVD